MYVSLRLSESIKTAPETALDSVSVLHPGVLGARVGVVDDGGRCSVISAASRPTPTVAR